MSERDTLTAEESGWTVYFEDFMIAQQQQDHHHHHHNHSYTTPDHQPALSDAASRVHQCNGIANYSITASSYTPPKLIKRLNTFKKTTRHILYDDSLEDTASSPVNSPKIGSHHMGFNQMKVDDVVENSLENGGGFDDHLQLQKEAEDRNSPMNFEQNNNEGTDLRTRGLCLVPLSMFVNYI